MELYAESLTEYKRLKTLEVKVGDLLIGNFHPIRKNNDDHRHDGYNGNG
jgi:hypothetical protein